MTRLYGVHYLGKGKEVIYVIGRPVTKYNYSLFSPERKSLFVPWGYARLYLHIYLSILIILRSSNHARPNDDFVLEWLYLYVS